MLRRKHDKYGIGSYWLSVKNSTVILALSIFRAIYGRISLEHDHKRFVNSNKQGNKMLN